MVIQLRTAGETVVQENIETVLRILAKTVRLEGTVMKQLQVLVNLVKLVT